MSTPQEAGAASRRASLERFQPPPTVWRVRQRHAETENHLAGSLRLHPVIARILAARGQRHTDHIAEFLSPRLAALRDPFELDGMAAAVDRALRALRTGEKIAVFGDYDADGLCATAILVLALRHLGVDPAIAIPHRLTEGYGLTVGRLEALHRAGVQLVITVDTGISAHAEIEHARALGMDVIVTDHHLCPGPLPAATAVVNPNVGAVPYAHGALCGSGVAFKFAHALVRTHGTAPDRAKAMLRGLLDLVGIATVADMVPLDGENRILARHGLESLGQATLRPGLRALLKAAAREASPPRSELVGFTIGPRLNAASRTMGDAMVALRLLLTEDEAEAAELAAQLEALNSERRGLERELLTASLEQLALSEPNGGLNAVVVCGRGWHHGVVGPVAARLCERFHRPAIVLGFEDEMAKGSARSIPGYDIHEALRACAGHLLQFGGHAAAAGLRMRSDGVDAFRSALNDHAGDHFTRHTPTRELLADAEVDPWEVEPALIDALSSLEPFGPGNPPPVLAMRGVRSAGAPRLVGQDHLRVALRANGRRFPAIGFSMGDRLPIWEGTTTALDVLFRPVLNTFRGITTLELELIDCRPSVGHVA